MAGERFEREYQLDLLGSLVTQERLVVALDHITAEMFDEPLRPIAQVVLDSLQTYGKPLTLPQLRRKLQQAGLGKVDLRPSRTWEFHRDEILGFAQYGAWRTRLMRGMDLLGQEEYGRLETLFKPSGLHVNGKFDRLDLDSVTEDDLAAHRRRPLKCGLPELDKVLHGGVSAGELAVIVAATGIGKSRFLVFVGGSGILRGKKVLHLTLEETKDKCFDRYVARLGGLTEDDLATMPLGKKLAIRDKIIRGKKGKLTVIHGQGGKVKVGDVERELEREKYGLLIVDYGDRLTPDARYEEKRHEYGQVFEDLKDLAQRRRIPLWTATQARREAYDQAVLGPEDVSESLTKAKVADFLITLGVETRMRGITDTEGWSRMILYVAKNRCGPTGLKIRTRVNLGMCQWQKHQ